MNKHYNFHDKLVLRTPRFPLAPAPDEKTLDRLIRDQACLEAIYLASPVLYEECIKWREGKITQQKDLHKISRALIKYYTRMTSRSTPFGLFSGCAVVPWTEGPTELEVSSGETSRHTRLDMHYLCALGQRLTAMPGIRERLRYFPNTSLYTIGEEVRYVEYKYVQAKRSHQISSVSRSEYLAAVLDCARGGDAGADGAGRTDGAGKAYGGGATYDDLLRQLTELPGQDITEEEAVDFVNELIHAQLLISELEPAITGPEFIYQLIGGLKRANGCAGAGEGQEREDSEERGEGQEREASEEREDGEARELRRENEGISYIISILEGTERLMRGIDGSANNEPEKYRHIMTLLDKLEAPYEEGKLFQTDLVRRTRGNGVNTGLRGQLEGSLTVLNKLGLPSGNAQLQSFMRRFSERYEDKEMPLLEVLDTETGIGYLEKNGDVAPLVEDLQMPGRTTDLQINWNRLDEYLCGKLQEARREQSYTISIRDEELEGLKENWDDLPPSLSIMFRMTGEHDETIYLEGAGGSSAANLLGRFAHADPDMHELIKGITGAEQANDPDIIFAEIIHLPESRIGNILLHPSFRNYEIPYLAKSSLPAEQRIDLQDLLLSVSNGRVVLRSRRLNREIIPRLTTSHNFSYNALPVYQLLCDLQMQGKRNGLQFHWGNLGFQNKFLPRVMYKHTILSPATWNLLKKDVEGLTAAAAPGKGLDDAQPQTGRAGLLAAVGAFRAKWELPRYVVLADGDNELLVDFESEAMVQTWLETVKSRAAFTLKEFFHRERGPVADECGRPYANQLVAVAIKNSASYAAAGARTATGMRRAVQPEEMTGAGEIGTGALGARTTNGMAPVQQKFHPGSEWLYYKVYSGIRSSDKILLEAVKPLTEQALQDGLIDKWFFIRYNDPGAHLRLRFRVTDPNATGELIRRVGNHLSPFESDGYIWKLQLDTYTRELERYGSQTIGIAETIFYHDSVAVLKMLDNTWGDERETLRWAWGMRSVEELLNGLRFRDHEKLELLTYLKEAFALEFNVGKAQRQQLTDKYRTHRALISTVMDPQMDPSAEIYPLLAILEEKSRALRQPFAEIRRLEAAGCLEKPLSELVGSYIHMLLNRLTTSNPRLHELVIYDFLFRHYQSLAARKKIASVTAAEPADLNY